jgi:UDP-N-acetylmuramate: L-alanyl-gamma-D-glutamyl-meso-diaminopimelate ligase
MELRGVVDGIAVYDDFAHHPTAVAATIAALRGRAGSGRLIAVLEPRSNTMRAGVQREELADSLAGADLVYLYDPPNLAWDLRGATAALGERRQLLPSVASLVDALSAAARPGDHVLIMSNGGFEQIHARLLATLAARHGNREQ